MKYLKMLGLAAVAAMAMTAFTAGSASATTLEIGGVTQNGSVAISASLEGGTSAVLSRTDGSLANTCTKSTVKGSTETVTGATVTGAIAKNDLTFTSCTRPVEVHKGGTLHVAHTSGTNGTVTSSGAEVTVSSIFGTLNCKTGEGAHLGTLTGVKEGHATMDISAVLNCGIVPSATWNGTYTVTSPTGLGVTK